MDNEKCPYCSFDENGDIPDEHPEILVINENLPFAKSIETHQCDINIHYNTFISTFADFAGDGNLVLDVEIFDEEQDNSLYHSYKSFALNYCPMCGRKFNHG